jgi:hypothetical protein
MVVGRNGVVVGGEVLTRRQDFHKLNCG